MRRILNDIPIKRKLMMIIMGVSSVVLFLVYLVFVIHEYRSFRRNVSHDMGFLASAVAHSCATGIVHDDPKAVSDAIAVLSGKQGVVEARVFNGEGVELAGYSNLAGGPTELVDPKAGATRWTSHGFRLLQPVVLDGEMLGHLYIRYEFGQLKSLATHYLLLAALVGLASALVAWLLSVRLQRVITEPVFHLADVVHAVALEKNYSVRASAFGKDELGRLIDGFNEMLDEIQERDRALQEARTELEERVDERTMELKNEVAERQRAVEFLKESEARYRAVVEDQTEMIIRFLPDGSLTFANRAICRYFSRASEELLLGGFLDMIYSQDQKRVMQVIKGLSEEQPVVNLIFRVRRRPGEHRWHQWTFRAIPDMAGKVMEYQGVGRDITEQRGTEEKLRMTQQSVEKANSMILWLRSDGQIHFANDAAGRQLGLAREDLMKLGFSRINPMITENDFRAFWQAMREERSAVMESEFRRSDGSSFPVEMSCSHFEFNGQEYLFLWGSDITERRLAGEKLRQAHREVVESSRLAGMAEVATGVLHNVGNVLNSVNVSASLVEERLMESRVGRLGHLSRMLKANADRLPDFLTNDPKGRQVLTYLESLSGHLQGEHERVLLEVESLKKNLDHIKDIVAMQQSYARVSGVLEQQDLVELVEDAVQINRESLAREGVTVERDFDEVAPLMLDKHKILQILVNLIRNANHAMKEGDVPDPRLVLRVRQCPDSVRVVCEDNGCGISAVNLSKVFSHGFTTKEHGHGFGLHSGALAAQEMGGTLSVHSDGEGRGAVFTLELPVAGGCPFRQEDSLLLVDAPI